MCNALEFYIYPIFLTALTHIYLFEGANLIFDEFKETNRNLIKLEISNSHETVTPVNYKNTINEMGELQRKMLKLLNKILDTKQNELEKLKNIKDKFIFYLKSFRNYANKIPFYEE